MLQDIGHPVRVSHDGAQDISSGYGTISGQLTGIFSAAGTYVLLTNPVIDMHWGTFDQGYTVHEYITNPPKGAGRKGSLFKLRALAMVLGVYDAFKAGTLNPQTLRGCNLILKLDRQTDSNFGDRNVIAHSFFQARHASSRDRG